METTITRAEDEPFLLVGTQGVGKTTLAAQLVLARERLAPRRVNVELLIAATGSADVAGVDTGIADRSGTFARLPIFSWAAAVQVGFVDRCVVFVVDVPAGEQLVVADRLFWRLVDGIAGQPFTVKICQVPGTPLSSCSPRSAKSSPNPKTTMVQIFFMLLLRRRDHRENRADKDVPGPEVHSMTSCRRRSAALFRSSFTKSG